MSIAVRVEGILSVSYTNNGIFWHKNSKHITTINLTTKTCHFNLSTLNYHCPKIRTCITTTFHSSNPLFRFPIEGCISSAGRHKSHIQSFPFVQCLWSRHGKPDLKDVTGCFRRQDYQTSPAQVRLVALQRATSHHLNQGYVKSWQMAQCSCDKCCDTSTYRSDLIVAAIRSSFSTK